jgi:hypothetical protein
VLRVLLVVVLEQVLVQWYYPTTGTNIAGTTLVVVVDLVPVLVLVLVVPGSSSTGTATSTEPVVLVAN